MDSKEQSEEIIKEIKSRIGVLARYLQFTVERDCECDGGEFYITIR